MSSSCKNFKKSAKIHYKMKLFGLIMLNRDSSAFNENASSLVIYYTAMQVNMSTHKQFVLIKTFLLNRKPKIQSSL